MSFWGENDKGYYGNQFGKNHLSLRLNYWKQKNYYITRIMFKDQGIDGLEEKEYKVERKCIELSEKGL